MTTSEKRILPVAYWMLCGLEALGTVVILLRIPPDPKHAILAGFSLQRILMLAGSTILTILFLAFAWASAEGRPFRGLVARWMTARKGGWLIGILICGMMAAAWLLVFTPPVLQGAAIERLWPYLMLLILVIAQGALVWVRLVPNHFHQSFTALWHDLADLSDQPWIGWGLLGMSFLIGLVTVFFTYYNLGDEGDALTVGWLISRGSVLYRDLFSHHFPLPYYWVGLVVRIFGPSILAIRLSVVVLHLLVFTGAMRFTRWYLPVGLTALAWALIGPLFLGNMLLYDTFGASLLIPAFLTTMAVLCGRAKPTWPTLGFVGGGVALASLSDPITLAPGLLILVILFTSGFLTEKTLRARIRAAAYRGGIPLAASAAIGLIFIVGMAVTQSLADFFRQAIWFNQVVYTKYSPMPPVANLLKAAVSGLDLLNPVWRKYPSPYYRWDSYEFLDQWMFMGFFFRFSIIALTVRLLFLKNWLAAGFIYLMASFLLWRSQAAMHAQAFILFGITCAAMFLGRGWITQLNGSTERGRFRLKSVMSILLLLPVAGMFFWQGIRGAQFFLEHRSQLSYQYTFSGWAGNAEYYHKMSCNQADTSIAIYPGRMQEYFAAQLPPATRYTFMFPWVAEVGQAEVVSELHRLKDRPIMVYLDKDSDVWGYPVKSYLRDLVDELDREYVQKDKDVYISPGLQSRCNLATQ